MFSGEESERFTSELPLAETYAHIEDCLAPLGRVEVDERGIIEIRPRSALSNGFAAVELSGYVRQKKEGQYIVTVEFSTTLTPLGWVLLVIGCFVLLLGLLLLLAPIQAQGEVARVTRRALRDL